MSDYLVQLAQNPQARRLVKQLGLPIPMPAKLRRPSGPWGERPLYDQVAVVHHAPGASAAVREAVARTLIRAGANPHVVGTEADVAPYRSPGEAYGRPPVLRPLPPEGERGGDPSLRARALVLDATGLSEPAQLRALHTHFHPWLANLGGSGRCLVIGRPAEAIKDPAASATQAALEGFVRSLAKEVGKSGATAQLVRVEGGAEGRLEPVLRFLLGDGPAYVSGQMLTVSKRVRAPKSEPPFTRPLEGKVVLVTGSARGIGAATAETLAREGAHVVVLDRPADDGPASKVAQRVGGSLLLQDLSEPDAGAKIRAALDARHGGVDVVVHNAGITRDKTLKRMTPENWELCVDVNLGAVVRVTDALLAPGDGGLRSGGRVVCLSSIAGIAGNFGQTNYSAAKSGIVGYVAALAPQVARRGIAVNAVAPGFIETRLTEAIPAVQREVARRVASLGQGGLPRDVAEVVTFLSTPNAHGLTGQTLRVCGQSLVGR